MKFCPSCEVKLKKGDSGLQCPKCNYVEGKETKQTKKPVQEHESQFNVLSQNETVESLPTIKIECEKCHYLQLKLNVKNVVMMKQFGGCYKPEVQMNLQLNSIDVQNVDTLGVITHNV